jgi:hypothetical protein
MPELGFPDAALRTGADFGNEDPNPQDGTFSDSDVRTSEDDRNTLDRQAKVAVDWSFRNLDTDDLFRPQFPMPEDGVSLTIGGVLVKQNRFGEQDPIVHWTHGKPRDMRFSGMLYARHTDESADVEDLFDQLVLLTLKDKDLGRPPIVLFTFGATHSEVVLIESCDPTIRSVDKDGFTKEIGFNISMTKYVPFSQKQIDPTKPAKESFYLVASAAEQSYEAIALSNYGSPLLGDRIRKRHPAEPFAPRVGSIVKVPPKSIALREEVAPAFHALSLTDEDAVDNYELILSYRSARVLVEVS